MQRKISFYLFLINYFLIGVRSLDLNENSDEIEIYKHLFAKLNKILDGNEAVQRDLNRLTESVQNDLNRLTRILNMDEKFKQIPDSANINELKNYNTLTCNSPRSITSEESPDNYCFGSNWIVIQRRTDGSENFYRDWNDYKHGFGNKSNEFFVGLEKIHKMTTGNPHELLITMQDYDKSKRYAKYEQFEVGSEEQEYVLQTLGSYSGNAGDSLAYHKGSKFSTKDRDNDEHLSFNCAEKFQSAWWFKACFESNLNGCYTDANLRDPKSAVACGIHWKTFRGLWYSLNSVEIMIRPKV